eukprot:4500039-Prymnesium_polylepis.1
MLEGTCWKANVGRQMLEGKRWRGPRRVPRLAVTGWGAQGSAPGMRVAVTDGVCQVRLQCWSAACHVSPACRGRVS